MDSKKGENMHQARLVHRKLQYGIRIKCTIHTRHCYGENLCSHRFLTFFKSPPFMFLFWNNLRVRKWRKNLDLWASCCFKSWLADFKMQPKKSRCRDCDLTVNCLVSALWESQSVTHAGRIRVYTTTTPNFLKLTARGLVIQQHNIKAVLTRLGLKRILLRFPYWIKGTSYVAIRQRAESRSSDNTGTSNRCLIDVCLYVELYAEWLKSTDTWLTLKWCLWSRI